MTDRLAVVLARWSLGLTAVRTAGGNEQAVHHLLIQQVLQLPDAERARFRELLRPALDVQPPVTEENRWLH